MLDGLFFRTGTSIPFWFVLLKIAVVVAFWAMAASSAVKYAEGVRKKTTGAAKRWKGLAGWVVAALVVTLALFVGYGPGAVELQSESGRENGMTEMQQLAPDENVDSVREATEESTPEQLKRQDTTGFEKEKKEADKYLKDIGVE